MKKPGDVWVPVTCDCGHQFDVSLVGKDPETAEFTCPACHTVDRFTAEQAAQIIAQYDAAKAGLHKLVQEAARSIKRSR